MALIPIFGTLVKRTTGMDAESGITSYQWIESQFTRALKSSLVNGILLDVDSHGGETAGMLDLADQIFEGRERKPIWAISNESALSAAYLLASAAERVFLPVTAAVGSVGVLDVHVDQSARDRQQGLAYTTVFVGERKDDFNPHKPLSDRARSDLQREVDRAHGLLVDAVAWRQRSSTGRTGSSEASRTR